MQSGYSGPREAGWASQSKHAEWITYIEFCVHLILCQMLRVFQANRKRRGCRQRKEGHRGVEMGTLRKTLWLPLDY